MVDYVVFCEHVATLRNQQAKQIDVVMTTNGDHNWSASQLIRKKLICKEMIHFRSKFSSFKLK